MGSLCELKLYRPSDQTMQQAVELLLAEVSRFEEKYTRFKPTSITSQINANAGVNCPVAIDEETARLLDYAHILFQQSDGLFDITSGVLRQAWDFKSNQVPEDAKIKPLLRKIGWPDVQRQNNTIQLPKKGMEIDFGGFVKEYVADVLATLCIENGIESGLINLGGDIRIIGPHPDGSPWRVGIQHPRAANKAIATVDVEKGGVATSGDYERYMIIDGVRYCHLLNPTTGNSIQPNFASVSIIAESCLLAGSFSTIAMLKSQQDKHWLDGVGLPYLRVDQSMNVTGTINNDII